MKKLIKIMIVSMLMACASGIVVPEVAEARYVRGYYRKGKYVRGYTRRRFPRKRRNSYRRRRFADFTPQASARIEREHRDQ